MACVDSSIGGKTAVNVQHGQVQLKNVIGTFHPPSRVYIDIACKLEKLNDTEEQVHGTATRGLSSFNRRCFQVSRTPHNSYLTPHSSNAQHRTGFKSKRAQECLGLC